MMIFMIIRKIDRCCMAASPVYPMVDVNDPNVAERLVRMEELYYYHFGMVYESRFNRMVVDPEWEN